MQRRHFLSSIAAASAASLAPGLSMAQDHRPLRLIVPFPPGGATDMVPRNLQDVLSKLLGQTVVVENRAGAGGSIGMAEVARATDGLTFGIATLSTHGVNPAVFNKLPYDAINDFVGVTEIVKAPGVIVVNPKQLPVKDFADLVKYLKANPGKASFATPGNGTIGHMWGALFMRSTGTNMQHIPYRGSGPAINDVLGGQVPVYFDQVASSLPHIKSGKVKALAVSWHVVDGRARALVGDVRHLGARALQELGAPNVGDGTVAGCGKAYLAGMGLEVGDEFGEVPGRNLRGVDHQHTGGLDDFGHAHEVVDGVVGQLLVDGRVHALGGQRGDAEGHAVGGAGHFGHADAAASAGAVLDHHGLAAQQLGQHVLHVAGHHVGGAAGREGNDDAQGTRCILGQRQAGDGRSRGRGGSGAEELAALHQESSQGPGNTAESPGSRMLPQGHSRGIF